MLQRPHVLKVEPNMTQPKARKVEGKVDSKLERKSFELIDIQNYFQCWIATFKGPAFAPPRSYIKISPIRARLVFC